ncbi:hypothetical protein S83_061279 [Arachis hypogaea]
MYEPLAELEHHCVSDFQFHPKFAIILKKKKNLNIFICVLFTSLYVSISIGYYSHVTKEKNSPLFSLFALRIGLLGLLKVPNFVSFLFMVVHSLVLGFGFDNPFSSFSFSFHSVPWR